MYTIFKLELIRQVMRYLFVVLSFSLIQQHFSQGEFKNNSRVETDQEAYGNRDTKKYKIMIVPFDYKMYISSLDRTIATKTRHHPGKMRYADKHRSQKPLQQKQTSSIDVEMMNSRKKNGGNTTMTKRMMRF